MEEAGTANKGGGTAPDEPRLVDEAAKVLDSDDKVLCEEETGKEGNLRSVAKVARGAVIHESPQAVKVIKTTAMVVESKKGDVTEGEALPKESNVAQSEAKEAKEMRLSLADDAVTADTKEDDGKPEEGVLAEEGGAGTCSSAS